MVEIRPQAQKDQIVPFAKLRDVQKQEPKSDRYLMGVRDAYQLAIDRYQDHVARGESVEARAVLNLTRSIFDLSEKTESFPEIDTPCDKSPSGQCEYDVRRDPELCKHCGRKT